ncbi:DNA internalization-related competence protein ComEC/Rec2 [Colwelliaceae bacterium 6471]
MERWLITFLLGAILSLFLPIVPALFHVFLSLIIFCAFVCLKNVRFFSGFFLGVAWILWHAVQYSGQWQDNDLDKATFSSTAHLVQGEIVSIPNQKLDTYRFNFKTHNIDKVKLNRPMLVRIRWDDVPITLAQGQQWQIKLKAKPANGLANPGGFNYQTWLRQKNILATGYVVASDENLLLTDTLTIRQQWLNTFKHLIPQEPLSALILALGFGERSQISPAQWQVLKATGTQHLIAISGLHLGLVASFSFMSFIALLRRLPLHLINHTRTGRGLNKCNARMLAILFSCLITLLYAYLAGFSVPTVRAIVMLLLYWGLRILGAKITPTLGVLLALFFIVTLEPFNLFNVSFWLSFYALIVIFFIFWRFSSWLDSPLKVGKFIKTLLVLQLGLSVLMLPIVAFFSQQISLVSFLANVFAVPLMSVTSIPLSLLAVFSAPFSAHVSTFFIELTMLSLSLLWRWLSYLSEQSWALMNISFVQMSAIFLLVFIVIISCLIKIRLTGICTIVSLIVATSLYLFNRSAPERWQVSVLDVGQGLAVAVEKNHRMLLYDTGASFPSGFNMADAAIIPYMRYQGINQLEHVIISHSDTDHAGGFPVLAQQITLKHIIANDAEMSADALCQQGQQFIWQGLQIKMLWPKLDDKNVDNFSRQKNDQSCVIQISDGHHSVLLSGDISSRVEKRLLKEQAIASSVLIVPHHGSKSSSSIAFLRSVAPDVAVFSSGYLNRWQMPTQTVLQRYQSLSIPHYNTSESGMIRLRFAGPNMDVESYREDIWPYWFAN